MSEIRIGLTYDDVLLVPRRSRVRSRQDVSTRSSFTPGIDLEVPIVSANMDTVTTAPTAVAMAQLGGIGVVHRFLAIEEEAAEVRRVKRYVDATSISEFWEKASFVRQTEAGERESRPGSA
jgi:IMP dehydrogenase